MIDWSGWELIGEDAEALYHDGHLPLDWRTKATALIAYGHEVDRGAALTCFADGVRVFHGVKCGAPPGEWYGGDWIDWSTSSSGAPEGWQYAGDHVWCPIDPDDDSECAGRPDIFCFGLEPGEHADLIGADKEVRVACRTAPPGVHLITAGEGWPWWSRIIGPVTVVVL